MATLTIEGTSADGYIHDDHGIQNIVSGDNLIVGATSSTLDTTDRLFMFFPPTIQPTDTINSVSLHYYVSFSSSTFDGYFKIDLCSNGCAGSTLELADYGVVTERTVISSPFVGDFGWVQVNLFTTDISPTEYTNICFSVITGSEAGSSMSIDSAENPSGRKPYLSVDYTPAVTESVGTFLLHQDIKRPEAPLPKRGFYSIK